MAALMKQRVIFVITHDSIGLGEDGPTHQPIEHLPSLRIIPQLTVWRPCDATETASRVGRRDRASRRADRAGAHAPGAAAAAAHARAGRRDPSRRLRAQGLRRHARGDRDRDRLRGRARGRRGARCCNKRAGACASCRCRAPTFRCAGRRLSRTSAAARGRTPRRRRGGARRTPGGATSAPRVPWSA